ncbi:unnamed protein product [Zymoseptoria tritici ST99CH_1E4]|uniref:Uncharacterized protein n=1 Tax=Zymoseptoria tritici ST99CH_1E4 TaxID=1276532 RepID=A0A2H1H9J4_ZYMTR|nr:unnamed protein product [Zymoseptoria tritici ST99CH_1E4]
MARLRRRSPVSERPPRKPEVDRREQIRLLLDQEDSGEENEGATTLAHIQRQAISVPGLPLAVFRAWWWEEATVVDTDTHYWAQSDVVNQLGVADAKRLEDLLSVDAKDGWTKAATSLASTMGWGKEFPKLHVYAMFGDMFTSRKFMDRLRTLIIKLRSRKKALWRLKVAQRERRAGARRTRNVKPDKEWVAKDAETALEGLDEESKDEDEDEDEEQDEDEDEQDEEQDEDEDEQDDQQDDEEQLSAGDHGEEVHDDDLTAGDSSKAKEDDIDEDGSTLGDHEKENNVGHSTLGEDSLGEDKEGVEEKVVEDNEVVKENDEEEEEEEEEEVSLSIENGRALSQTPPHMIDNDLWNASFELPDLDPDSEPEAARTALPVERQIRAKPPNPSPSKSAAATTPTAFTPTDHPSDRMLRMSNKRQPDGMSENPRHAKRRLAQQLQEARPAPTSPPLPHELEAWLNAVSALEGGDGPEDDLTVLYRDLDDTAGISFAKRTCIIYSNKGGRVAAAYVDCRRKVPVCITYVLDPSALDAEEAFERDLPEYDDGVPKALDFTPACTGSWSLVAGLTCLCAQRPIPDGTTTYPPIWQHALKILVAPSGDADLDTDSALTSVADVLPSSGSVVSPASEPTDPQPRGRVTGLHLRRLREQTQAICKALREKTALANALLVDAALIASVVSAALDRVGSNNEPDQGKTYSQERLDSCKSYLESQRRLASQCPEDRSIKDEVTRLELQLKQLEARRVPMPHNRLKVVERHMQRLAGFIAARSSEYAGELLSLEAI